MSSGMRNPVGLIGWLKDCDAVHGLVKEYRENCTQHTEVGYETTYNARYLLSSALHQAAQYHQQAHEILKQYSSATDRATSLQKTAMFMHTRRVTSGTDLANILRLKSVTCDAW